MVFIKQGSLNQSFVLTVLRFQISADGFVITRKSIVGISRNAVLHDSRFKYAYQTVPMPYVRIQKCQRFA